MSLATLKAKVEQLIDKIESFPVLTENTEVNYTRPSWWLPYPEITKSNGVNEIFLLIEVDADTAEYEGIDLTDTAVLPNGRKQFWKRIEGTQIEGEMPELLEVYANCTDEWCFNHTAMAVTTALTNAKAFYPKLQIIGGTPMKISSSTNTLAASGNLRLINCEVNIRATGQINGIFAFSGLLKAPVIKSDVAVPYAFNTCTALTDGGVFGGASGTGGNCAYQYCMSMEKIHIAEPCAVTSVTFNKCTSLRDITVDSGFSGSLYLHHSTRFSARTLHAIIENYADCTGKGVVFQVGETNLAKIDEAHKTMLTEKGIEYR